MSTYLHLGRMSPSFKSLRKISFEINSAVILLFIMSFLIGLLTFLIYSLSKQQFVFQEFIDLTNIALLSVIFSAPLLLPLTVVLTIKSYKLGWNPDNLTAPLIFLLGDIVTMPLIFIAFDVTYILANFPKFLILLFFAGVTLGLFIRHGKENKDVVKENFLALFLCLIFQFTAGFLLMNKLKSFIKFSGLFTMLPAFLSVGGSIGGILIARFSTLLHLGILHPSIKPEKDILASLSVTHIASFVIFGFLGISAYLMNIILNLDTPPFLNVLLMITFAGQVLTLFLNFISYYLSILSFKKGLNPDNVGIPLISALMDYAGTACFVLALCLFIR